MVLSNYKNIAERNKRLAQIYGDLSTRIQLNDALLAANKQLVNGVSGYSEPIRPLPPKDKFDVSDARDELLRVLPTYMLNNKEVNTLLNTLQKEDKLLQFQDAFSRFRQVIEGQTRLTAREMMLLYDTAVEERTISRSMFRRLIPPSGPSPAPSSPSAPSSPPPASGRPVSPVSVEKRVYTILKKNFDGLDSSDDIKELIGDVGSNFSLAESVVDRTLKYLPTATIRQVIKDFFGFDGSIRRGDESSTLKAMLDARPPSEKSSMAALLLTKKPLEAALRTRAPRGSGISHLLPSMRFVRRF